MRTLFARFFTPMALVAGLLTAAVAAPAQATPASASASPAVAAVCGGADGTVKPTNDPFDDCANPGPANCRTNGSIDNPDTAVLGQASVYAPGKNGHRGKKVGTLYQVYSKYCKGTWSTFVPKGGSQPQLQVFIETTRNGGAYPIRAPYTSPSATGNVFSSYLETSSRAGGTFTSKAYVTLNGVNGPTAKVC